MRFVPTILQTAGVVLAFGVIALWAYSCIYMPLVAGEWRTLMLFVAGNLFWIALIEAARRKADSVDYSRR